MKTPETKTPVAVSAPTKSSMQLSDDWLKSESTKLTLSLLDDRRKARRSATVLLWLAAAYIGVAAIGHVQSAKTNANRTEHASKQLIEQSKNLTSARSSELAAFKTYLSAVYESETLAGQVMVAGKDVEISKEVNAQLNDRIEDARRKYYAALAERGAAEGAIENFKKKLIPGELRELVPADLKQSLKHAQEKLSEVRDDLAKVQNSEGVAVGNEPSADKTPVSALAVQYKHLDLLKRLASAKRENVRTENEWQKTQRELSAVQSSYTTANDEYEKLKRDPSPLTLPVLSLAVAPAHFFLFSPLLLLILYWNIVVKDRTVAHSLRHVAEGIGTELIGNQAIVRVVPEIESARTSALGKYQMLLPDLVTVVILGLLACLGPMPAPLIAMVATLVTVGARLKLFAQ